MAYRPYVSHKQSQVTLRIQPPPPPPPSSISTQQQQALKGLPQIQLLHTLPHPPTFPKSNNASGNIVPLLQEILHNYTILGQIGEGTFGLVLKASTKKKYKNLSRIVAIKKLLNHDPSQGFHITTIREIKAFKSLKHKNLLSLIEVLSSSPKSTYPDNLNNNHNVNLCDVYLVLPYLSSDIAGLISNTSISFAESEIKCFTIQLLQGINFLHNKGFVHRDIKTANILVSSNNVLKIADFGLTRKYSSSMISSLPNKKGCVHGGGTQFMTTLVVARWYRAPELLLNERQYTTAIDMWSIGCVFAEFFIRKPLLTGNTNSAQLNEIFKLVGSPVPRGKFPLFDKLTHDRPLFVDTSTNPSTSNIINNHDKTHLPAVMTSSSMMSTTAAAAEAIPTAPITLKTTGSSINPNSNLCSNKNTSHENPDIVDFQQLKMKYVGNINPVFSKLMHPAALNLLCNLLTLDPHKRFNALDCLDHEWFKISPLPCIPEEIQQFESRHEMDIRLERSLRHQQYQKLQQSFHLQQKVQHNPKKEILNFLDDSFVPAKRLQQINNNFSAVAGGSSSTSGLNSTIVNYTNKVNITSTTWNRNRSNSNNSARLMGSLVLAQDTGTATNNSANSSAFMSQVPKNLKNFNYASLQYAIPSPLNTINIHHADSPNMPTPRSPFDLFQGISGMSNQGTTPGTKQNNNNNNGNFSIGYFAKLPDLRLSLSQMIRSESQHINDNSSYNEGNGNSSSWRRSWISNAGSYHQRQYSDASSTTTSNSNSNSNNNNKSSSPSVKVLNLKLVKGHNASKSFDLKSEALLDGKLNPYTLDKRTSLKTRAEEENDQDDSKSFYSAISHSRMNSYSSGIDGKEDNCDVSEADLGEDSTFVINHNDTDLRPPNLTGNIRESKSSSSLVLLDITEVLSNSTKRIENSINTNSELSSPISDSISFKNKNIKNNFKYTLNSFLTDDENFTAEDKNLKFQKIGKIKDDTTSSLKKSRSFGNLANILKSNTNNNINEPTQISSSAKNKQNTNLSNSMSSSNINESTKSNHKHSILKSGFFKKKKNIKDTSSKQQSKKDGSHYLPSNSYRKYIKTDEEYEEEKKVIEATKKNSDLYDSFSSNNSIIKNNFQSPKLSISNSSSLYKILPKSILDKQINKTYTNSSNLSALSASSRVSSTATKNNLVNDIISSEFVSSYSEVSKSPLQQLIHPYKKFSKLFS